MDGEVLGYEQHEQDAHHDEVSQHGARESREADEQRRDEQREAKREQVDARDSLLAAEHRDDLVQEVDGRADAARSHHDVAQPAELLEVHAIQEAHDGDAHGAHDHGNAAGERHDDGKHGQYDEVEATTTLGVCPDLREAHELRLVDEPDGHDDDVRRREQRVEVQLVVVGQRAFHGKLGHVVDEVVQEQRHEQREALHEQILDARDGELGALWRLEVGERQREQHKRRHGRHGHGDAGRSDAPRDEDERAVGDDDGGGAYRLRDAGEVELVHLLQAALVDVGQAVDGSVGEHSHAQREHLRVISAQLAVQDAHKHHDDARERAVCLVVRERVSLGEVGDLEGAHAVVGDEQKQRSRHEGHGEAAGLLDAHELRRHHGEHGEHDAPGAETHGVPDVVSRGVVRGVLLRLARERSRVHGADEAVPPVAHEHAEAAWPLGTPRSSRRRLSLSASLALARWPLGLQHLAARLVALMPAPGALGPRSRASLERVIHPRLLVFAKLPFYPSQRDAHSGRAHSSPPQVNARGWQGPREIISQPRRARRGRP